ncbi:SafA/ExsA family spore coat assembly protein [Priestia filamentosa]|uniref:SafA/ExsA family spore coat assembly protein n=1 Tax=Priestia filamentosa TaxID=1402861 RepID=UPI003978A967
MKKIILALGLLLAFIPMSKAEAATVHTVKSGDTMWKIAVKYQVGVSELIQNNSSLKNPNYIYPGQKIAIPEKDATGQSYEEKVIALTNKERAKVGLPALKANWELSRVARYKAEDMRDNHYFDHNSPTYGSPFTMMKNFGIQYKSAGENIAAGQQTPEEVVAGWMNSPGHKANILNKDYNTIGVGYAKGGSYGTYWSQMFTKN